MKVRGSLGKKRDLESAIPFAIFKFLANTGSSKLKVKSPKKLANRQSLFED